MFIVLCLHVKARKKKQEELERQRLEGQQRKQQVSFRFVTRFLFNKVILKNKHELWLCI